MTLNDKQPRNAENEEGLALALRWRAKPMAALVPELATSDLSWWTDAREARELARELHRDQTRTGVDAPYFLHLTEVAAVIGAFNAAGFFAAPADYRLALTAAWLHDAAEDQGLAFDEVARRFGLQSAVCVEAMTKRPKDECPDPMADSLARLARAGAVASIVKVADRISNLSWEPPSTWTAKKARRYGEEGRLIAATLAATLPPLACLALEAVADAYMRAHGSPHRSARHGA